MEVKDQFYVPAAVTHQPTACAGLILGKHFGPEDGGDMFLRNVRVSMS
jgi:hypothetical protein